MPSPNRIPWGPLGLSGQQAAPALRCGAAVAHVPMECGEADFKQRVCVLGVWVAPSMCVACVEGVFPSGPGP
jgi:hypothetical protein